MANDAPVESGLLDLKVTEYGQHDYSRDANFVRSSSLRLLGLEWTLKIEITAGDNWNGDDGVYRWSLRLELRCWDVDHSSSQVVYPARLRLRVILPNGQVITDQESAVSQRFHSKWGVSVYFYDWSNGHPEFPQFLGPPNHPLFHSFMMLAQIDVMGQPTVLLKSTYDHSAKFFECKPLMDGIRPHVELTPAGYRRAHKRLIVWRSWFRAILDHEDEYAITCSSVHPLIPRSVQVLCTTTRMRALAARAPVNAAAALSNEGRLTAYIAHDYHEDLEPDDPDNINLPKSCHLFVLDLVTGELIRRQYDIPQNSVSGIVGLAHTQRGWVAWSRRWFWRLAEQMEVLVDIETTHCALATHRYLYSYTDTDNDQQTKLFRWDLREDTLARKSFDVSIPQYVHQFVADEEERLFAFEPTAGAACVSRVILEAGRCWFEPMAVISYTVGFYSYTFHKASAIVDWPRVILVNEISDGTDLHSVARVCWSATPAVKDLALLAVQKNTGTKITFKYPYSSEPNVNISFWTGGMTEDELKEILGRDILH